MTISEKLPMLEGWKYEVNDIDDARLGPGKSMKIVYEKDVQGYVKLMKVLAQGKGAENTEVIIRTDYWEADTTIKGLHDSGLVERAQGYLPFCPLYDTTADTYSAVLSFSPLAAYKNRIWITLKNPNDSEITVDAAITRIVIKDMEKFKSSYRELTTSVEGAR